MDSKYVNILYNSGLTTLGVIGIGFGSRKLMRDSLGTPLTLQGNLKLGLISRVVKHYSELHGNYEVYSIHNSGKENIKRI